MSATVKSVVTPVQLYRHLLRTVRKLPASSQDYYKHHIRQHYNSHMDETDPERIERIVARAMDDAEWVLKKYTKPQ